MHDSSNEIGRKLKIIAFPDGHIEPLLSKDRSALWQCEAAELWICYVENRNLECNGLLPCPSASNKIFFGRHSIWRGWARHPSGAEGCRSICPSVRDRWREVKESVPGWWNLIKETRLTQVCCRDRFRPKYHEFETFLQRADRTLRLRLPFIFWSVKRGRR